MADLTDLFPSSGPPDATAPSKIVKKPKSGASLRGWTIHLPKGLDEKAEEERKRLGMERSEFGRFVFARQLGVDDPGEVRKRSPSRPGPKHPSESVAFVHAIIADHPDGITERRLNRITSRHMARSVLRRLVATLVEKGVVKTILHDSGGRPTVRYRASLLS